MFQESPSSTQESATCWPSLATIASESCVSRATVKRALATLERGGLVRRERMPKPQSTRYHLRLWGD
ncbi:MAG: helix-turn-helix domain-containing protein [Thiotrichales bacterium]|nr:helix-turn-helix domain-containing protein [Thiotrichales bacterium]